MMTPFSLEDLILPFLGMKSRARCGNISSSCGKVTTVYVPIECATGASLGYAFINLKDHTKGFTLSGSLLGGRKLHVMMAKYRDEFGGYSNFRGCQRCRNYQPWLVHRAIADSLLEKYRSMEKRRTVGTSFSKFGRFTANIARC